MLFASETYVIETSDDLCHCRRTNIAGFRPVPSKELLGLIIKLDTCVHHMIRKLTRISRKSLPSIKVSCRAISSLGTSSKVKVGEKIFFGTFGSGHIDTSIASSASLLKLASLYSNNKDKNSQIDILTNQGSKWSSQSLGKIKSTILDELDFDKLPQGLQKAVREISFLLEHPSL